MWTNSARICVLLVLGTTLHSTTAEEGTTSTSVPHHQLTFAEWFASLVGSSSSTEEGLQQLRKGQPQHQSHTTISPSPNGSPVWSVRPPQQVGYEHSSVGYEHSVEGTGREDSAAQIVTCPLAAVLACAQTTISRWNRRRDSAAFDVTVPCNSTCLDICGPRAPVEGTGREDSAAQIVTCPPAAALPSARLRAAVEGNLQNTGEYRRRDSAAKVVTVPCTSSLLPCPQATSSEQFISGLVLGRPRKLPAAAPQRQATDLCSGMKDVTSFLKTGYEQPEETTVPQAVAQHTCSPCECGVANKRTRIVGGQVTYVNEYPWMALLMYRGKFYCGATLLNARYLLTAAHCVSGFSRKKISVRIFEHDRDSTNETVHIDRKVKRIVKHKRYSESNFNSDIALVEVDEEVKIQGDLRPVCLPVPKKSFTNYTGLVTGWGVTKAGGSTSALLHEVEVPIMSNKRCKKTSYGSRRITENMMCAGYPEGKKDSCQGDSGGPLHIVNGTHHHIVGVVSWGEGCAMANHPGVYTRVNRYLTWIRKNTQDSCYCS